MKTNTQLKIPYIYYFLELLYIGTTKLLQSTVTISIYFCHAYQIKHKGKVTPDLCSKEWVITKQKEMIYCTEVKVCVKTWRKAIMLGCKFMYRKAL